MPGDNCCINNCGSSRRKKGIGLFSLPSDKKEHYREWREKWLAVILKYREPDDNFKNLLKKNKLFTCELHYKPEEIITWESDKKTTKKLVPGTLPTLNLPLKSHEVEKKSRPYRSIVKEYDSQQTYYENIRTDNCNSTNIDFDMDMNSNSTCSSNRQHSFYKDIDDIKKRITSLKSLISLDIKCLEDSIIITKASSEYETFFSKYRITIDSGLGFTIKIYECFLPEDHDIYKSFKRSMQNVTVSNLVNAVETLSICCGVNIEENNSSLFHHVIPLADEEHDEELPLTLFNCKSFLRASNCLILLKENKCGPCQKKEQTFVYETERKEKSLNMPAKLKAPIAATHKRRIAAALRAERLKCHQTTEKLNEMKLELKKNSTVEIDDQLSNDFTNILSNSVVTPFMNLFWQQQKELLHVKDKKMRRFHPMIIRYCLSLYLKSKTAYEEIRNSGVLVLPSSRTLIDYKNFIKPKVGFSNEIITDLKNQTNKYFDVERYIVLSFDEMKIKSNLVFDKHTNEIKGYLDLGTDKDFSTIGREVDTLASHALVFYLRGIATDLKYSFAHFATGGVVSIQLMALFWEAVGILEFNCNLWVIAATCDGCSPNRKFFQLHREGLETCHKTGNIFSPNRYIYWFSDAPHLVKTVRNCWASSGAGKNTRYMWNNDRHILWTHVSNIFDEELEIGGLKCLPKITSKHIYLTPFSVMTVKYAAQVLSETVSKALIKFGGEECSETAEFCHLMDSWFDCLNTRCTGEDKRKKKPFLAEYRRIDDGRFSWLTDTFLSYFKKWEKSVEKRPGNFNKSEREKMFLAKQSYTGLLITTNSLIECTKFLLGEGVEFVLSERFCQDVVEEYFGNQRELGRRSDNPDIVQFGYNDNALRVQRFTSRVSGGNTCGRYDNKRTWGEVVDDPLPKRLQKRLQK